MKYSVSVRRYQEQSVISSTNIAGQVQLYLANKPGAPALTGGLKSYFKGDPDIQIYQLNNSLQYQRGSHARHMHFWSSFEPSRLILKL